MSETVVLKVGMSCGGCVGAVKRVLGNMEGVETFDIDLEQKKVTVKGNVQPDAVLQTVAKTGKKTEFWPTEASPSSESEKPVEPPVVPSCEARIPVEPVVAPSSEAAKPVEPIDSSCSQAEKSVEPITAPSSESEKPLEHVAAPSSEAEKPHVA